MSYPLIVSVLIKFLGLIVSRRQPRILICSGVYPDGRCGACYRLRRGETAEDVGWDEELGLCPSCVDRRRQHPEKTEENEE